METARVLEMVRSTRELLMPHWGNVDDHGKKTESAHSVVTALDLEIEKRFADELQKIDPGSDFAGEEFGGSRDAERLWLCDPIDGTAHFVRGMPFCSVMLAYIESQRVVFSVIYDFVNDKLYHASRGRGAFCNSDAIRVSTRPIEMSYLSFETRMLKPENAQLRERVRGRSIIFSSINSGYEFILVASGKLEARICYDGYGFDYDFAPGTLLVEEAGGRVANIGKSAYDFRDLNYIAANPHVFEALTSGPDAIFPISQQ